MEREEGLVACLGRVLDLVGGRQFREWHDEDRASASGSKSFSLILYSIRIESLDTLRKFGADTHQISISTALV